MSQKSNQSAECEDKLRRLAEILKEAKQLSGELDSMGVDWLLLVARCPQKPQGVHRLTTDEIPVNAAVLPAPEPSVNE